MIKRKITLTALFMLSIAPFSTITPMDMIKQIFAPTNIKSGLEGLGAFTCGILLMPVLLNDYLVAQNALQLSPAAPEVDTFVRDELRQLGYSPALVNQLKIVTAPNHRQGFGVIHYGFNNVMQVPITKEMLLAAQQKNITTLSKNAQQWLTHIEKNNTDASTKEALTVLSAMHGIAADANSLNIFKGLIAHEAGHAYKQSGLLNTIMFPLLQLGSFYIAKKAGNAAIHHLFGSFQAGSTMVPLLQGAATIPLLWMGMHVGDQLFVKYKKYTEYSADTQAINTIQEPAVLRATENFCEKHQLLTDKGYIQYDRFHPSGASRAQRFKKAAEKLEAEHRRTGMLD